MKILLFCPLHPLWGILHPALESIHALDVSGFDVTYHYEDERRMNGGDAYDQITAKYQYGRGLALDGGYDAMLTIEYDNVVPVDALQKLAQVDADVAYGLYVTGRGNRWLAFIHLWPKSGITYSRDEPTARAAWGDVMPSAGVGFGCTLIRRHVLEGVPFRREKGHPSSNDWWFALDLAEKGYRQAHDCGVVVGHIRRNGDIAWPIPAHPFARIEKGKDVLANIPEGELGEYICNTILASRQDNHYYQVGDRIMLTPEKAAIHLRKGQVSPLPIVPEPKKRTTKKDEE